MQPTPFSRVYNNLLSELLASPHYETNTRTGRIIRTLSGAESFLLDLSDRVLPVPASRKVFPKTAAAEIAFFVSGTQDITWLRNYTKIWDKFTEDDGVTLKASYGYRWRYHFGRDQLFWAIEALRQDPSDRRIFVSAWDPASDGLGAEGQKNVPCPIGFTLSLQMHVKPATDKEPETMERRLHSSLFIRSSDVFVGLPYDVMGHAMLMAAIAVELEAQIGTMHVTLAHPHLYDVHEDLARKTVAQRSRSSGMLIPHVSLTAIKDDPESYVELADQMSAKLHWPQYAPKVEIVP